MIETEFSELWHQSAHAMASRTGLITQIGLHNIRGIRDLSIAFNNPVTVLAGENGTGKSTVLFAAACAYENPNPRAKSLTPAELFPNYQPPTGRIRDKPAAGRIRINFTADEGPGRTDWDFRGGQWHRKIGTDRHEVLAKRPCYLRATTSFANPTEVRGLVQMGRERKGPSHKDMNPTQVEFASTIVPHLQYNDVVQLSSRARNLLFAYRDNKTQYSELHMAGGERTALRLGLEIAELRDALVLIDEIETGLHPRAQQLLMHGLQRLALHNNLQVIVTTHSPVILDCVPTFGRRFLERDDESNVRVREPYPDVVHDVLYGRPQRSLYLLCEDNAAEGILNGMLDHLVPKHEWPRSSFAVVRDTGADEFPTHAAAFAKCAMLDSFVFVLDGDQEGRRVVKKLQKISDRPVIFLPGSSPETWVWQLLGSQSKEYASLLGVDRKKLHKIMDDAYALFGHTRGSANTIHKYMLARVAEAVSRSTPDLCRIVARHEIEKGTSDLHPAGLQLRLAIEEWRRIQLNGWVRR